MYGINQVAVNNEKRRKQDQYYQHQQQAAMNLEFKRNQQETVRAFNDPASPAEYAGKDLADCRQAAG